MEDDQTMPSHAKSVVNAVYNAFRGYNFLTIANKIIAHVSDRSPSASRQACLHWCQDNSITTDEFGVPINSALWAEAKVFGQALRLRANEQLKSAHVSFGGGAAYELLYFLTRLRKPRTVLETGVAAGWSSCAILEALEVNGGDGRLFSSDFPYIRQRDSAAEIGTLVPAKFRERWRLAVDGDRVNLPRFLDEIKTIDLFHYDSDKSMRGRRFAYRLVKPLLSPQATVVFDDVQDNCHFRDLVERLELRFSLIRASGKFVGVIEMEPAS